MLTQAERDPRDEGPADRWLRLSGRLLIASFTALAAVTVLAFVTSPSTLDAIAAVLVLALGGAALLERRAVAALEARRLAEAESFGRILSGLSRSVSPDAIVAAIVDELGTGTDADHVVVVRRRPELRALEATLHATRPGVPASSTTLPLSDLEDPAEAAAVAASAVAHARRREAVAIPIVPDPVADRPIPLPVAVPVGAGGDAGEGASREAESEPLWPEAWPSGAGAPATAEPVWALRSLPSVASFHGPAASAPAVALRSQARPLHAGAGDRVAERIAARIRSSYGLTNTVAAPLRVDGRVEGAIVLSRRTADAWSPASVRILDAAAVEASAALARVYSLRQAETRASTDALTGLPNRRYFDEYVGLIARRRRADDRLGVLMIDIDRFKSLNDTFGHAVGDHVLRAVAGAIAGAVREDDVPARFGGEEFVVLLRNPSPDIAVEVGERVRRAVGSLDLAPLGVPGVSVSVGVSVAARPGVTIDGLIEDADKALYRAKRSGRDRVVAA